MRLIRMQARLWTAGLALVALTGCDNQLPTVTGDGAFPGGRVPVTLELTIPATQLVVSDTVYEGYDTPLGYLLVANAFDGVLTANAIARISGFPDSVTYTVGTVVRTDRSFTYGAGRITAPVDSAGSRPRAQTPLELLAVVQPWDTTAVSWQNAVDRPGAIVPWLTPGGTKGGVLAQGAWVPGDTTLKDTVVWKVDSLTVGRLARGEIQGLLVRNAAPGSRLELGRLTLTYGVHPAGKPDTTIAQQVATGTQTFLLTPDPPGAGTTFYRVGGLAGARTVFQVDLSQRVSTCAPPATAAGCTTVPLGAVELDQATLLIDPAPVPLGFRPLARPTIEVRRVLEPELGSRAPLGDVVASQVVAATAFGPGAQATIALPLTGAVAATAASTSQKLTLALLSSIGAAHFGTAWFAPAPRLRLLYTVPRQPTLP